ATAKLQIALGPHSVFGATSLLMREVATLAEQLDVRLHTHLSGDASDEPYCLDLHGVRPVDWCESVGYLSSRTWVAHAFFPNQEEISRLGAHGVGVAHCATAGLMMSVGIAPVRELLAAGVPVGIGTDGSSNGDMSSMWMETRMALVANRFRSGPAAFGARQALEMATRNGAACLGRTGEIGQLSVGANADIALWPVEGLRWAGAGVLDVAGRVVLPAFVDGHVHLDKAFADPGRVPPELPAVLAAMASLRQTTSADLTHQRMRRAVDALVRNGTTAARVQVEIE